MKNAKKTLSLVMIAIFTTFIVLSGVPTGAAVKKTKKKVTAAQKKATAKKAAAAKAAAAKKAAAKKAADAKKLADAKKKAEAKKLADAIAKAAAAEQKAADAQKAADEAQAALKTAQDTATQQASDLEAAKTQAEASAKEAQDAKDAQAKAEADAAAANQKADEFAAMQAAADQKAAEAEAAQAKAEADAAAAQQKAEELTAAQAASDQKAEEALAAQQKAEAEAAAAQQKADELAAMQQAADQKAAEKALADAAAQKIVDDATAAVVKAEGLTNTDTYDLVGNPTDFENASEAITAAIEAVVNLGQDSPAYAGLMARIDAANAVVAKAQDDIDTAAAEADKLAAEKNAEAAATKAIADFKAAVDAAKTVADAQAAVAAYATAKAAVDAVGDTTANAASAADLATAKAAADAKVAAAQAAVTPAKIATVSAIDGTITVTFDKNFIAGQAPVATDFVVTKTVTTSSAVTSTVTPATVVVTTGQAVITVPVIPALDTTAQSVVYAVAYTTGAAVSAVAYPVAQNAALTVASVTTTNLKTVLVKFNRAVDSTTATTATNYTLSSSTVAAYHPTSATLQADGQTVMLVIPTAAGNQTTQSVDVVNVKDTHANVIAEVTPTVTFTDLTIPSATKVTVQGPNSFTVFFSEPVYGAVASDFVLDGGMYSITPGTYDYTANSLTFTTGTNLAYGAHTFGVNASTTNIKDFANFTVPAVTLNFTTVADTTAPRISAITSATQTSVTVKFSKQVKASTVTPATFYHTFTGYTPDTVTQGTTGATYDDTYTLAFTTHPLAASAVTLYALRGTVVGSQVVDAYGNVLADATETLTTNVVADVTKPVITSATASSDKTIVLTFNKALNIGSAQDATKYVFEDATGAIAAIAGIDGAGHPNVTTSIVYNSTNNTVTFTFASSLAGGSYKVAASGVVDNALVPNALDATVANVTVGDSTAPTIAANSITVQTSTNKINVPFSEAMITSGASSVLSTANYLLNNAALPTGTTIAVGPGAKSVIIAIPSTTAVVAGTSTLSVGNVSDLAGNKLAGFGITQTVQADSAPGVIPGRVFAKGSRTVTAEINQPLTAISTTGWAVGGIAVVGASYNNQLVGAAGNISGSLVTLTLTSDISASAPGNLVVTGATGTKNTLGTALADITTAATDKIVPTFVATTPVVYVNSNTITLTFTENLKFATFASGMNGFTVSGGTPTSATIVGGVDGSTVTITGASSDLTSTMTVSYNGTNITDVNGNVLAPFTAQALSDAANTQTPVAANYRFDNGTGKVQAIADVTFGEPVKFQVLLASTAPGALSGTSAPAASYSTSVYLNSLDGSPTAADIITGIPTQAAGTLIYYRTVDMAGNATAWTADGVATVTPVLADVTVTDVAGATTDTIALNSTTTNKALLANDTVVVVAGAETMTYTVQAGDPATLAAGTLTLTVGGANQVFTGTLHTAAAFDTAVVAAGTVTVQYVTADGNIAGTYTATVH